MAINDTYKFGANAESSSPSYVGLTLTGLTADRLVQTDSNNAVVSVEDFTNWIAGTTNQISVADDGDGTVTLSLPQDIHTGAFPTFAGLILTSSYNSIHQNTSDGSDNKSLAISGGGGISANRGATFWCFGNEYPAASGFSGVMLIEAGDVVDASHEMVGGIVFETHSIDRMIMDYYGNLGIGTIATIDRYANARVEIEATTEQLRLSYDIDNYVSFTVDSDGDIALDSSKASFAINIDDANLTTAGTVQAEQLTSTDDITMAGLFTNTLADDDATGLVIDGDTNPIDYSDCDSFLYLSSISRTVDGSGSADLPAYATGGLGFRKKLIWNYNFSGTRNNFGTAKGISAVGDQLVYSGDIEINASGIITNPYAYCQGGYSYITRTGAVSSAMPNGSLTLYDRGVYYSAILTSEVNRTGAGTIEINVTGGDFSASGTPSLAGGSGDVAFNYIGGNFAAVGNAVGTSIAYGGKFSATGADTNYGIYVSAGNAYVEDDMDVNGDLIAGTIQADNGFDGSFTNGDGDTVTVVGGVITDVS